MARGGDRPGAGRPGIGGEVLVRLGALKPRVDVYAASQGITRAEAVRQLVEVSVGEWEREQPREAWLISYRDGDSLGVEGVDVALVDGLETLASPEVGDWMAAQGFTADDPDECMFLAREAGPSGWESLRLELSPRDAAAFAAVLRERAGESH